MIWGIRCSCRSFGTRATALPPPITLQIFLTYKEEEIWLSEYSDRHISCAANIVWFFSLEPLLWNQICKPKRKNFIKTRFKYALDRLSDTFGLSSLWPSHTISLLPRIVSCFNNIFFLYTDNSSRSLWDCSRPPNDQCNLEIHVYIWFIKRLRLKTTKKPHFESTKSQHYYGLPRVDISVDIVSSKKYKITSLSHSQYII